MAKTSLRTTAQNRCFGGVVSFHEHHSQATGGLMRFSAYVPPQAELPLSRNILHHARALGAA